MRVLLIHPNDHSGGAEAAGNWPPAWVADLTGTLKAGGCDDVHCVGAMTHHLRNAQVRARIEELRPGIVGCTAITPAIHKAEGLLQIAKDVNPKIVTVLGGTHGTCRYPQVLETQCEACGDAACRFEIRWQGRCGSPRPGAPPKIGLPLAARVVCRSPPPNRPLP